MTDRINFKDNKKIDIATNKLTKYYRNKGLKYFIKTFGCQMNVHESEQIAGIFESINLTQVDSAKEADIILLNTCCVRETAELRIKGYIGALKRLKRENNDLIIILSGCMTQQEAVSEELMKKYRQVDLIMGTSASHMLPIYLNEILDKNIRLNNSNNKSDTIAENIPTIRDFKYSAWVNIMYGCNNFCSYCIVPYVRGRERSRDFSDIVEEVKDLTNSGYLEVTLLGQNVNSYSSVNGEDFPKLLRALNEIKGIKRIRFMTSHPKDLSDSLIDAIAECENVCNHVHLPLQSGSSKILKDMNRHYTAEYYTNIIKKLRAKIPDVGITTDIIVGYPGETHEQYLETLDFIKKIKFDSAFTFKYSVRSGTAAAKLKDFDIDADVKQKRLAELLELQKSITAKISHDYIGRVVTVLFVKQNEKDPSRFSGKTGNGHNVSFNCPYEHLGKLIKVKITDARVQTLIGEFKELA